MKTNTGMLLVQLLTWTGRVFCVLVVLLWGGFFVEHLWEWFLAPGGGFPPAKVWGGQALHFLMLAGLVLALFKPVPGGIVAVSAALAFFYGRAGANFALFTAVTALPILMLLVSSYLRAKLGQSGAGV